MLSSQVDRDEPLYIYGPPKIREFVDAMRRTLEMYINYEIVVREIEGGSTILQAEGFAIRSHSLSHTKPCLGYCLEEAERPGHLPPGEGPRAGRAPGPDVVPASGW